MTWSGWNRRPEPRLAARPDEESLLKTLRAAPSAAVNFKKAVRGGNTGPKWPAGERASLKAAAGVENIFPTPSLTCDAACGVPQACLLAASGGRPDAPVPRIAAAACALLGRAPGR